jgi:hypothetical protein
VAASEAEESGDIGAGAAVQDLPEPVVIPIVTWLVFVLPGQYIF